MPDDTVDAGAPIIIVGAGLSGLATARALKARGIASLVLEADRRPGGVIRSGRVQGRVLEWGPQRARLTAALSGLIRELQLDDEVVRAAPDLPLYIYRAGALRTVPLTLRELARTDLFTRRGRLRLLAEPLTRPARPDENIAAYFERRFGREAYLHLLGPLFGGLYASDPRDMLVRHALDPLLRQLGAQRSALLAMARRGLARRVASAPAVAFRAGLQTLTDALHASVAAQVRLGEAVVGIRRSGSGFIVESAQASRSCRHVVLTVEAAEAARLLTPVDGHAARRLAALTYNRFAIVHLLARTGLRGMGFQVSLAEQLTTRGVTFNDALFGRTDVHTAFLGGARDPLLVQRDDEEIGAVARDEFRTVTGSHAQVLDVTRVTIPAWDRSWTALDGFVPPPGVHLCANYESRAGIPGRFARAEAVADELARIDRALPAGERV